MKDLFKDIRKADIILLAALIILGAALSVPAFLWKGTGDTVKVTVNGKLYGEYSLKEDRKVEIERDGKKNILVIEDGKAWMDYSTCKNQVCVHTGKIHDAGRSIVCLPNRVSVTIEGKGGGEYDAVSGK